MKTREQYVFEKARRAIEKINDCRQTMVEDFCSQVKDVVIVASSSRGGSSIFTELLRHSPELLHFKGEINPFLALAGFSYPYNGRSSDMLVADDAGPHHAGELSYLQKEMSFDVGIAEDVDLRAPKMYERFLYDLHWRICVQWPEIDIEREDLFAAVDQTFNELHHAYGWRLGEFKNPQLFHILFLRNLRRRYTTINPYYYDLRPDLIREYCPDAQPDFSSPSCFIIEEPPFVPIVPKQYVTAESIKSKPLILKTPSNVYRLPFLKELFCNARFRILHLTRNPADAINGLVDGWRYNGFFSHKLNKRLEIKGYSDLFSDWGTNWWKYDLPPGWEEYSNRPLEYICGYQWCSAHRAIIDYTERNPVDYLRIKFEDVIGPIASRREVFSRICHWLGINGREIIAAAMAEDLPPVMVTTSISPRKRRWFKKAELIRPVLVDPGLAIVATAEKLGYSLNEEIGK